AAWRADPGQEGPLRTLRNEQRHQRHDPGRQEPGRDHARRSREPDRGARREDRREARATPQGPAQGGRARRPAGRRPAGGRNACGRKTSGGEQAESGRKARQDGREAEKEGRGEIQESTHGGGIKLPSRAGGFAGPALISLYLEKIPQSSPPPSEPRG